MALLHGGQRGGGQRRNDVGHRHLALIDALLDSGGWQGDGARLAKPAALALRCYALLEPLAVGGHAPLLSRDANLDEADLAERLVGRQRHAVIDG